MEINPDHPAIKALIRYAAEAPAIICEEGEEAAA